MSTDLRSILMICLALVGLSCGGISTAQTVLFSDDLDDNSEGWQFESLAGKFGINGSSDSVFGFDYSALGIPEAPNSQPGDSSTRGLRIRTNNPGNSTDQAAAIIDRANFSGKYTVQVDLWANWAADENLIGTTEHGGLYVGNDTAANPTGNFTPIQRGAGAMVSTDGDCSNCDFVLLKNQFELDTYSGQYSVRDLGFGNQPGFDNTDSNSDPMQGDILDLPAIFPAFSIAEATGGLQGTPTELEQTAGAVGFQWITLTAVVDPTAPGNGPGPGVGTATFTITKATTGESFVLGTVDNSRPDILDDDMDGDECDGGEDICINGDNPLAGDAPVDLEGRISLFWVDFFSGSPADLSLGFGLFDNVIVTETPDGLPGDYNEDGTVNAADYTVWRDHLGQTFQLPNEDPLDAEPGVVGTSDYAFWKSQFGEGAGAGGLGPVSVPEPATWSGWMIAALVAAATRGRKESHREFARRSVSSAARIVQA